MKEERVQTERHRVSGERLLTKIKQLVHQGNIRRIIIKNEDGAILIEVPLTIGVVGTLLAPVWVAIGAMAALVANFDIVVQKIEPKVEEEQKALEPVEPVREVEKTPTVSAP